MEQLYAQYATEQATALIAIDSPTGYTKKAAEWVRNAFASLGFEAKITNKGGVLVDLGGIDKDDAILFEAHADTLGAMVAEIKGNGRSRPSITADAFEALLAAIYLDSGETFEVVSRFVLPFIEKEIVHISETGVFIDYKTALQQIVQQASGERLEYVVTGESGPDHDKHFEVEARLNSNVIGRGMGKTKRAAEQQAAKEALVLFGQIHEE